MQHEQLDSADPVHWNSSMRLSRCVGRETVSRNPPCHDPTPACWIARGGSGGASALARESAKKDGTPRLIRQPGISGSHPDHRGGSSEPQPTPRPRPRRLSEAHPESAWGRPCDNDVRLRHLKALAEGPGVGARRRAEKKWRQASDRRSQGSPRLGPIGPSSAGALVGHNDCH